MYIGDSINDIDLSPNFWDIIKVKDVSLKEFITVFNDALLEVPSYIPQDDIKYWIDELIKKCPLYNKFLLNFYKFKFNTDSKGEFYKQVDNRNLYRFDFFSFHDMIQELCDYYDFNLKLFLTNFNKMFKYYIRDLNEPLIEFSKHNGIDLNNLNKEHIISLLNLMAKYPFSPIAVSYNLDGPIFYHNIETVFLQYWYEVQTSKKERIFSNERQLSWMDFDMEIIKELSAETIMKMVVMLCDVDITEHEEFRINDYGIEYAEKVLSEKKEYKTLEELFSENRINTCLDAIKYINMKDHTKQGKIKSEFKKGVCMVLRTIKDECKLVEMVIVLNRLIISYLKTKNIVDYENIINALDKMKPRLGKTVDIKEEFTSLTTHTFCLFIQICISVIDNPDIDPFLKTIAENFSGNCKQCKKYYTCFQDGNNKQKYYVLCEHKTLHYYTFTKWWYMYIVLIEKEYKQNYSTMNLSEYYQRSFQVWYPKSSYCDKCYTQYKNLEEVINNSTKGLVSYIPKDMLPYKFLVAVMKSKIPKYRAIYNSKCDMPIFSKNNKLIKAYESHKTEIESKMKNVNSALNDLLKNIREEINEITTIEYDT